MEKKKEKGKKKKGKANKEKGNEEVVILRNQLMEAEKKTKKVRGVKKIVEDYMVKMKLREIVLFVWKLRPVP